MPPELVVADAPYKLYPGGVIALWCKDWLAGARATLTTEADALSCTGQVVRDTQKVATSIVTSSVAAYGEALDTLEIPLASIPIEEDLNYRVFVSHRVEGEFSLTDGNAGLIRCYDTVFQSVCGIGAHGTTFTTEGSPSLTIAPFMRDAPFYMTGQVALLTNCEAVDTIFVRAYSQNDNTIEVLLDQIILLPAPFGTAGGWTGADFFTTSPAVGQFSDIVEVDGADGGDDGGKFTIIPNRALDGGPNNGPGDFQRKASGAGAEYLSQISEPDFWTIYDSRTDPDSEPSAVRAYSLHYVHYRPTGVITRDEFDRTVTPGGHPGEIGNTPEGFGWLTQGTFFGGGAAIVQVDGSGVMRMFSYDNGGGVIQARLGDASFTSGGARLNHYDQIILTGKFRIPIELYPDWRDTTTNGLGGLGTNETIIRTLGSGESQNRFRVEFEHRDRQWRVASPGNDTSWHDVSSWYADGDWVRFKLEHRRHLFRVKIWEDGSSEPGAWDWEGFIPEGLVPVAYPYGDNPDVAMLIYAPPYIWEFIWDVNGYGPSIGSDLELWWDDIQIERDAYGSNPSDGHVRLERPNGTTFGEITIPYGAAYFVSWGTDDFTDLYNDGYDDYSVLVFSLRTWNETTAPEMQSIMTPLMWFRSVHGGIVSMNWRSSARQGGIQRILLGDR